MAEELADQQVIDNGDAGLSGAEIAHEPAERSEPARKPSLRETLNKSVEEVRAREERARDDQGKFAKEKLAKSAPEKAAAADKSPQGDAPDVSSQTSQPASKPVGPPPGWSAESKAFFESLPPDHPLRQDIDKREEELSNGFKSYSEKTKQYEALEQVLAPARTRFQQFGLKSDAEAVSRLFQWEAAIASNPVAAISKLAETYGINLSQFAQQSPAPSDGSQGIPEHLKPVLDEFGQLKQQVTTMLSSQQMAEQQRVSRELETFAKDKPHFEKVRVAMGQMMAAGIVAPNDLDGAYQRAIWADPELRDQLLREQDEKRQAEFKRTQAEAAAKARAAAVSPPPRARQAAVAPQDKSSKGVRGAILASINELREDQRA
jgi:hypothetical protein